MQIRAEEISQIIRKQIKDFDKKVAVTETGTVLAVGDGIARVYGLDRRDGRRAARVRHGGVVGLVLNLEEDNVGVALLGDYERHPRRRHRSSAPAASRRCRWATRCSAAWSTRSASRSTARARSTTKRVAPRSRSRRPASSTRKSVHEPLQTGIKAIDAMIPIGRGQRELIIGDRQTGKTAVAIDTIINQKGQDVYCIYVAIGQKQSTVAQVVEKLARARRDGVHHRRRRDRVASRRRCSSSRPTPACTMGEYFRDSGQHALIIYDDLSKQAVAYRQLSLLLRRPPGREAYPGDVFYLHSPPARARRQAVRRGGRRAR